MREQLQGPRTPSQFPPLSSGEFNELVSKSKLPVGLYISHKCCRVTDVAKRQFLLAAQSFKHVIAIFEVDAVAEKELISQLDVKGVPIFLVFTSGSERGALLGFYHADELQKEVWSIIFNRR